MTSSEVVPPPWSRRVSPTRLAQLVGGSLVLGVGVALLLAPRLGSDGFSTLVNGIALSSDVTFAVSNIAVSASFVLLAWLRRVRPGAGTVVQMVVVGLTVSLVMPLLDPHGLPARIAMLAVAFPVVAVGIALYLGSNLGAGPMEAAALAFDPPIRFAWTYSALQLLTALVGWRLGAAIGPGTVAVMVLLGPLAALAARVLRLRLEQD